MSPPVGTEVGEDRGVHEHGKRRGGVTPAEPAPLQGHCGDTGVRKSRTSLPPSAARCHHSSWAEQPPLLAPPCDPSLGLDLRTTVAFRSLMTQGCHSPLLT